MSDNSKEVTVQEIPLENPNSVSSVYTNHARITMTQWDARFVFAEIIVAEAAIGPSASPKVSVELRANVVMTPAHAKAFLNALQGQIEAYEKANGEIKVIGEAPAK